MNKISKLIGGLVGGATPASLIGFLTMFGVSLPENVAAAVLVVATWICGAAGVYVAPKNAGTDTIQTVPVYVHPEPTVAETERPGRVDLPTAPIAA
ncbi:hypothetical protein [Amycolatopsis sp.]|uniref:hypothetical protein n=1 Tax=Amycolatopsis sp. TaxID=37632 RepID=UPI002B7C92FB|nr:hypothetical protein [Amycolatopsis sp.]HVV11569.1 hypothetical protein [Amycolatopsis sp.]